MKPYELKTSPDTNGFEVVLTDGTLIGYAEPTDDPDWWVALSVYDEDFYEDADSEDAAAWGVWDAYQHRKEQNDD